LFELIFYLEGPSVMQYYSPRFIAICHRVYKLMLVAIGIILELWVTWQSWLYCLFFVLQVQMWEVPTNANSQRVRLLPWYSTCHGQDGRGNRRILHDWTSWIWACGAEQMGTASGSVCLLPGLWTSPRNWKWVRYFTDLIYNFRNYFFYFQGIIKLIIMYLNKHHWQGW
jgi:hypothetical protein